MSMASGTPSSGSSSHLLPAGEKRERAAPFAWDHDGRGKRSECIWVSSPQRGEGAGRRMRGAEGLEAARNQIAEHMKPPAKGVVSKAEVKVVTGVAGMTDITKRRTGKTGQARQLRQNETEAEYRLWSDLRNRLLNGHKFARQVPLGAYIADFVCRERRLIVELDGSQHAQSTSDSTRTAWLNDQGYDVLRFWNGEVLSQKRDVLETILAVLDGRITEGCETLRFYPAKRGSA